MFIPYTNYEIIFRAYDDAGNWGEDTAYLVLIFNQDPIALIDSIAPSPARFDDEITFNGTGSDSDGNISSYEWLSCLSSSNNPSPDDCEEWEGDFLFLSDLEDFTITDLDVGKHFIFFKVCDDRGDCSESQITTFVVNPNSPPFAEINSIAPSQVQQGNVVVFRGTGTDGDGTVVGFQWNSSIDGKLSTEANFSSSTLSFGNHIITFRVQDNDGHWGEWAGFGNETQKSNLWIYTVPIAIAGQNATGTPGVPLQFSGAGTDEDGTIAKYEWDFDGDGVYEWSSTENGLNTYIYNNEGTYTATLRVTDNDGFSNIDTVEVTISEKKIQIDDEGNVTVTDTEENEEGIPSVSLITLVISIGLIAIFRRK